MGAADAGGLEIVGDRRGQFVERAGADVLRRPAMAGQVDGVDGAVLGERRLVEHPARQVGAEAVDEDDRRAVAASPAFR